MSYPALCNDTSKKNVPGSDPSGSAQFFVAVGVLAMLYTIGTAVWYVIFELKYLDNLIQYMVVSENRQRLTKSVDIDKIDRD